MSGKKIMPLLLAAALAGCTAPSLSDETQTAAVSETETVSEAATEEASVTETTTTVSVTETTTSATTTETTTEETTTVTTELPFEDTPENAYSRLSMSFQTENGTVYPEDYGGVYSYGGTLYISITEYTPSEYYTDLLSEYSCVRYQKVTHSLNELSGIAKKAAELLDPEFAVMEYYVDVPSNKAAVSITEGDPKKAQNYLKTVADLGFTLNEVEISMADVPETEEQ